jgi:ankyrin repeat protein
MHQTFAHWGIILTICLLWVNPSFAQSPLVEAVKTGNLTTVKQLVKQGNTDINQADSSGHTSLMLASREGYVSIAKILLKQKPDINLQNYFGENALMLAVQGGHTEMVKLLLKHGANQQLTDRKGWNALMLCRSHTMAALLLKNGAAINHQTPAAGITALMVAAEEGNELMVKLLLQSGANSATTSKEGLNAAEYARRRGHEHIAILLTPTR